MRFAFVAGVAAISACAPIPADSERPADETVMLVKSMGLKQCEGGTVSPDALEAELRRAGITPRSPLCGTDGLMHITVCGAGTGDLGVFEISKADVTKAKALGFGAMPRDGRVVPCR